MLVRGCGAFVENSAEFSKSYKMRSQSNWLESQTVEGDSPVDDDSRVSLTKVPEYHGTREIPWESGRTIFQG